MQQENNRFVLRALILKLRDGLADGSAYEYVISSSTVGDVLARFAAMLKEPSTHNAYDSEILGFDLQGNGKLLMEFLANHSGLKVEINWHQVHFFSVDHHLLKALNASFPEQAAMLKSHAIEEAMGL